VGLAQLVSYYNSKSGEGRITEELGVIRVPIQLTACMKGGLVNGAACVGVGVYPERSTGEGRWREGKGYMYSSYTRSRMTVECAMGA